MANGRLLLARLTTPLDDQEKDRVSVTDRHARADVAMLQHCRISHKTSLLERELRYNTSALVDTAVAGAVTACDTIQYEALL
jgi:hypothetical protein